MSDLENDYDLQAEVDISLRLLKTIHQNIDFNNLEHNRKEILKGMINFLVEKL